jgi:hypothetical protein
VYEDFANEGGICEQGGQGEDVNFQEIRVVAFAECVDFCGAASFGVVLVAEGVGNCCFEGFGD